MKIFLLLSIVGHVTAHYTNPLNSIYYKFIWCEINTIQCDFVQEDPNWYYTYIATKCCPCPTTLTYNGVANWRYRQKASGPLTTDPYDAMFCRPCTMCDSGQYRTGTCSGDNDWVCKNCNNCNVGYYKNGGCDTVSDTICSPCRDCLLNTYNSGCGGTSAGTCVTCTCPINQYAVGGCNTTFNSACTACPDNTRAPSGTNKTVSSCVANAGYEGTGLSVTICTPGYYCEGNGAKIQCPGGKY